jgi:hypothetical protein
VRVSFPALKLLAGMTMVAMPPESAVAAEV